MATRSTRVTVLVAGAANLFVALTKLAAGLVTGSSAMMAEAAHSVADTLNQAFLLQSLRDRPADERHPFGYGQDRYFWSLLAAFGTFVAGAGYSIFEGLHSLDHPPPENSVTVAYAVLVLAFFAEGASLLRATRQVRKESGDRSVPEHVRRSPDVTFKAALFEDTAAVIGLAIAASGLVLRQVTGNQAWDSAASIAIGVLLGCVAVTVGVNSRSLLIGRAADPDELEIIHRELEAADGVEEVVEVLTMHLGPEHLIVAARVSLASGLDADQIEDLADGLDVRLRERLNVRPHVFVDPTQTDGVQPERVLDGP